MSLRLLSLQDVEKVKTDNHLNVFAFPIGNFISKPKTETQQTAWKNPTVPNISHLVLPHKDKEKKDIEENQPVLLVL